MVSIVLAVGAGIGYLLLSGLAHAWRLVACGTAAPGVDANLIDWVGGFLTFNTSGCGAGIPGWFQFIAVMLFVVPWVIMLAGGVFHIISGVGGSLFGSIGAIAFLVVVAALIGVSL